MNERLQTGLHILVIPYQRVALRIFRRHVSTILKIPSRKLHWVVEICNISDQFQKEGCYEGGLNG